MDVVFVAVLSQCVCLSLFLYRCDVVLRCVLPPQVACFFLEPANMLMFSAFSFVTDFSLIECESAKCCLFAQRGTIWPSGLHYMKENSPLLLGNKAKCFTCPLFGYRVAQNVLG